MIQKDNAAELNAQTIKSTMISQINVSANSDIILLMESVENVHLT